MIFALWSQYAIGITTIKHGCPDHLLIAHHFGAATVLFAVILGLHCARKPDPRHV